MTRSTRIIFLLAAFWLVTLTAPLAAATRWSVCALPVAQAAQAVGGDSVCPMKSERRQRPVTATAAAPTPTPCCCCAGGGGLAALPKTHLPVPPSPGYQRDALTNLAQVENCGCTLTPGSLPAERSEVAIVSPFLSAAALVTAPALAPIAPPFTVVLPQAPIRGPSAVLVRTPIFAPDTGRAPPATA